jgi:hypothetical protein
VSSAVSAYFLYRGIDNATVLQFSQSLSFTKVLLLALEEDALNLEATLLKPFICKLVVWFQLAINLH